MERSRAIKAGLIGLLLLACTDHNSSLLAQTATPDPVKWSLHIKSAKKQYHKGAQFKVQIMARIKPGWHLYSLDEIPNGPRPTRITLPTEQPFALAGEIEQPAPIIKFDENFGVETQFYQASVSFLAPIKIALTAGTGTTKLVVQTRYQTCNEHLCLPPKTITITAPLTIK